MSNQHVDAIIPTAVRRPCLLCGKESVPDRGICSDCLDATDESSPMGPRPDEIDREKARIEKDEAQRWSREEGAQS